MPEKALHKGTRAALKPPLRHAEDVGFERTTHSSQPSVVVSSPSASIGRRWGMGLIGGFLDLLAVLTLVALLATGIVAFRRGALSQGNRI